MMNLTHNYIRSTSNIHTLDSIPITITNPYTLLPRIFIPDTKVDILNRYVPSLNLNLLHIYLDLEGISLLPVKLLPTLTTSPLPHFTTTSPLPPFTSSPLHLSPSTSPLPPFTTSPLPHFSTSTSTLPLPQPSPSVSLYLAT